MDTHIGPPKSGSKTSSSSSHTPKWPCDPQFLPKGNCQPVLDFIEMKGCGRFAYHASFTPSVASGVSHILHVEQCASSLNECVPLSETHCSTLQCEYIPCSHYVELGFGFFPIWSNNEKHCSKHLYAFLINDWHDPSTSLETCSTKVQVSDIHECRFQNP